MRVRATARAAAMIASASGSFSAAASRTARSGVVGRLAQPGRPSSRRSGGRSLAARARPVQDVQDVHAAARVACLLVCDSYP